MTGERFFQISESDLRSLEEALPLVHEAVAHRITPEDTATRNRLALLKRIVSDVRWSYGPYEYCEEAGESN